MARKKIDWADFGAAVLAGLFFALWVAGMVGIIALIWAGVSWLSTH